MFEVGAVGGAIVSILISILNNSTHPYSIRYKFPPQVPLHLAPFFQSKIPPDNVGRARVASDGNRGKNEVIKTSSGWGGRMKGPLLRIKGFLSVERNVRHEK